MRWNGVTAHALFLCGSVIAARSSRAQEPVATNILDPLSAVWGSETVPGPAVRGELTIDGRGETWTAQIAGYRLAVEHRNGEVRFTLPGGAGRFRGHSTSTDGAMLGEWIQPQGEPFNNEYASPVRFESMGASVWKGAVIPLDQRISLYVSFKRVSAGHWMAFISDPGTNFFRRRTYAVTMDGSTVRMSNNGKVIEGSLDAKNEVLSLQVMSWMPAFQFTRRREKDAVGFYARTPAAEGLHQEKPIVEGDGWATASLVDAGLRREPIAALVQRIMTADAGNNPVDIQSLLIARHGHLAVEEYFYGFDGERPHDMRSASKTFAPVLVGVAKEQGAALAPSTLVASLFAKDGPPGNDDARKRKMSLRDIMSMTAGNACDDNDDDSPGNEDKMEGQEKERDWYKYTLDLPMVKEPGGEDAVYCSADLNLVAGAVAQTTGRWLPDVFDEGIARPLQFGPYSVNLMPNEQAYMGGGMYLRARDQLKLGQVYLDGGVWNGKRIVSKEWVAESTAVHAHFQPKYSLGQEHRYGYGWHIHDLKSAGKTYRVYAAEGNGGQFVIVVPELELVVGITGGSYGEFDKWYRWVLELVPQFILPAAVSVGK